MANLSVQDLQDFLAKQQKDKPESGGGGLTSVLSMLNSMYQGNNQNKALQGLQGQINDQTTSLNNIYSPNSPYAQQMQQELLRRDAASGRRSQYGPRSVELAAKLSDSQARTSGNILNNLNSQSALQRAQAGGAAKGSGLNGVLALARATGLDKKLGGGDLQGSIMKLLGRDKKFPTDANGDLQFDDAAQGTTDFSSANQPNWEFNNTSYDPSGNGDALSGISDWGNWSSPVSDYGASNYGASDFSMGDYSGGDYGAGDFDWSSLADFA